MYRYDVVSMPTILRDYIDPDYIDDEHKDLVDIADCLYNNGWQMKDCFYPEAKALFDRYGEDFWHLVLKDAEAIDGQLDGHDPDDLILDYMDYLSGAMNPKEN